MKQVFLLIIGAIALSGVSSDPDIERMLKNANDVSGDTMELMEILTVGDIDKGTDAEDEKKDLPSDDDILEDIKKLEKDGPSKRSGAVTKLFKAGGRMVSKAVGKFKGKLSNMAKKFKRLPNKATQKGKEGWQAFKNINPKQAGKKMLKSVMKELYEYGKEEALQLLSAALMEWVQNKINGELCECFAKQTKNKKNMHMNICRCCIKPPGFKRACIKIRANRKKQQFAVVLNYKGKPYLKGFIKQATEEERDEKKCSAQPYQDKAKDFCSDLPDAFHFLKVCITPGDIEVSDDGEGFGGCLQIKIEKLDISFEKCLQYTDKALTFVEELDV